MNKNQPHLTNFLLVIILLVLVFGAGFIFGLIKFVFWSILIIIGIGFALFVGKEVFDFKWYKNNTSKKQANNLVWMVIFVLIGIAILVVVGLTNSISSNSVQEDLQNIENSTGGEVKLELDDSFCYPGEVCPLGQ